MTYERCITKMQKDLQDYYYIFIDKITLKNLYQDMKKYGLINNETEYNIQLEILANSVIRIINRYRNKYA